jgi:hypothetical protein
MLQIFPECDKHEHDEVTEEERPVNRQVEDLKKCCEAGN